MMSTDFRFEKRISASDLFDGRLEAHGVREHKTVLDPDDPVSVVSQADEHSRCLTDGESNFLWVYINDDGKVGCVTRYMPNGNPGKILGAIADTFDTNIFSEHEPQFWGFDTQEAWDAAMQKLHEEYQAKFYVKLCDYVRGKPDHGIGPGTIGDEMAKIAKTLAAVDRSILDDKDRLLAEVDAIWNGVRDLPPVEAKPLPADIAAMRIEEVQSALRAGGDPERRQALWHRLDELAKNDAPT